MNEWLTAAGAGLFAGGALFVGALIAWFVNVPARVVASVMAFGAGVLISALAFDLVGEAMAEALSRRAEFELGLKLDNFTVALPDFRYRAVDSSGIVENEICPVYTVTTTAEPQPNADEAMDYVWVSPQALRSSAEHTPWAFSPWLVLQLNELDFSRSSAAAPSESESVSA